jgi:hypothetical protein
MFGDRWIGCTCPPGPRQRRVRLLPLHHRPAARGRGVVARPLTDEQKATIAEARRGYDTKGAERETLHRDALRKAKSAEKIHQLNEELARDRDRFGRDRDRKIEEIRERWK